MSLAQATKIDDAFRKIHKNKNSKFMTHTVALSFDVAQVFTTGI